MRDEIYKFLENAFGLDINTILSGIGIAMVITLISVVKYILSKRRKNKVSKDEYSDNALFNIKGSMINTKINKITTNSSSKILNVGKDVKNSEIKNVDTSSE